MLEDIDKIQKYKANLLPKEEKKAFEEKIRDNQVLQKMVDDYDQFSVIADAIIEDDIINSIKREKKYLRRKKIIMIGSIILILAMVFLSIKFLIPTRKSEVYADLYEKYYSPPMGNIIRNENGTAGIMKSCDLGHHLLDKGKYEEALAQFTIALKDPETRCREKAEFYSALVNLRKNNLTKATEQLTAIYKNSNHSFYRKTTQLLNEFQPYQ